MNNQNISVPVLSPQQVCFVVEDVPSAVDHCVEQFGWGPFHQFSAPVANATYRDWTGDKLVDVALGMAGNVQVEFIRVREGHDAVETYQAEYGIGFQHLGISCRSREAATAYLQQLGAVINEQNEYPGIRFAFMDVPTGPAMFEILQRTDQWGKDDALNVDTRSNTHNDNTFCLDRASIVTEDMDKALSFYSAAFGWIDAKASIRTLRYGNSTTTVKRYLGNAGTLQLELLQPEVHSDDPYAQHLRRGNHGLVHAGGKAMSKPLSIEAQLNCEWIEDKEAFTLYDWVGGKHALQAYQSVT